MRLALLALVLALPAASSAGAPAPPQSGKAVSPSRLCGVDLRVREARPAAKAPLRPLGELPPGNLTLTVVDQVGDCIEPRVVGQGYGAFEGRDGR